MSALSINVQRGGASTDVTRALLGSSTTTLTGVLDPTNTYGYFIDPADWLVRKVRISDLQQVSTINVGTSPRTIIANESAGIILVGHNNSPNGRISRIRLSDDTVTDVIQLPSTFVDLAVNPQGTFAVTTNGLFGGRADETFSIIDLSDNSVETFSFGTEYATHRNEFISFSQDGKTAYVTRQHSLGRTELVKIDVPSGSVSSAAILTDTNSALYFVDLYVDASFAYVLRGGSSLAEIVRVRLSDGRLDTPISVPWGATIAPSKSGLFLYVSVPGGQGPIFKINQASFVKVATTLVPNSQNDGIKSMDIGSSDAFALLGFRGEVGRMPLSLSEPQSLQIHGVGDRLDGASNIELEATATSGFPVTFTSLTPNTCSVSGTTLTTKAVGRCEVKGLQSGGMGWDAAESTMSFNILRQTISFPQPVDVFDSEESSILDASSDSGLTVSIETLTPTICSATGRTVSYIKTGTCRIQAVQSGDSHWSPAVPVERSFNIYASPPSGDVGVSILDGAEYTNVKNVALNLVWPRYATAARISNDGGFAASKSQTVPLSPSIEWTLNDSVKGMLTKVVYVRFVGSGIDGTRTYSDDIVFDNVAPLLTAASASRVTSKAGIVSSSGVSVPAAARTSRTRVVVSARDNKSGVTHVQVSGKKSATGSILLQYKRTSLVRISTKLKKVYIRVRDGAGNWSRWGETVIQ